MKSFYLVLIVFTFLFIACDEAPVNTPPLQYKDTATEKIFKDAIEANQDRFLDKNSIEYAHKYPEKYKEYQKQCGLQRVEPCCK